MSVSFSKSYDQKEPENVSSNDLSMDDFKMLKYPLEYIKVAVTNFYADIDVKASDMEYSEYERIHSHVIDAFSKLEGYVFTDGSYYNSSGKKLSFHIHNNGIQIYKQSFTWNSEYGTLLKNQIFNGVQSDVREILEANLDDSVYGNKTWLRTPYSLITNMVDPSKNKLYPHRPMKDKPIQAYLVTVLPNQHSIHPLMKKMAQQNRIRQDTIEFKSTTSIMTFGDEVDIPRNRTEYNEDQLLDLLRCLDPKKRAYHYHDWLRLAFMIRNVFGMEGIDYFVEISKDSGYERFDEEQCRNAFKGIQNNLNKVTIGSLKYWAKKDNLEEAEKILKKKEQKTLTKPTKQKEQKEQPCNEHSVYVKNDKEAGIAFYKMVKDIVTISNGLKYVKIDNKWVADDNKANEKEQQRILIVRVHNSYIYYEKLTPAGPIFTPNYASLQNAKIIVEEMWLNVHSDETFADKLVFSTMDKICFRNGIYDFVNKVFMTWDAESARDVHTCVIINDDFRASSEEEVNEIKEILISCLGEERVDDFLRFFSRSMAGCLWDKIWSVFTGDRNCGKGVIIRMIEAAFPEYIGTMNAESLLLDKSNMNSDPAKKLSWAYGVRQKRFLVSSELKINECDPKNKPVLDGNIVKKLSSGGDKLSGRQNYMNETTFFFEPKIAIMCNDLPEITPKDAEETRVVFRFPYKYCNAEEYHKKEDNGDNMKFIRKGDDTIKTRVSQQWAINAFRLLVFSSYLPCKYVPSQVIRDDMDIFSDEKEDDSKLIQHSFEYTGKKEDIILVSQMSVWIHDNGLNMTVKKLKIQLLNIGGKHSKTIYINGKMNCTGIIGIKIREKQAE
jgi:hypothetical protein